MEKYSVLMAVYYKEKADEFKESLNSMFNQTVPPDDFVLVCDGELGNDLNAIILEFKETYPRIFNVIRLKECGGLGNALNVGMDYCKNKLIARMDSDDISLPYRCSLQLKKFEENKNLDIVSGTILEFSESVDNIIAKKELPVTNEQIYKYARKRCPFNHPTVMLKKEAVKMAGGYQDFPLFEDYYLWLRMLRNNVNAYNIKEPLYLFRADKDFYKRRGGILYLKKVIRFRKYMYKNHFCNLYQYLIAIMVQSVVCLIPVQVREFIYNNFLRSK